MKRENDILFWKDRHMCLRGKYFKKVVSVIVFLVMTLALLPTWTVEAGDASGVYTVYFDASKNPSDNGWSTTASMYIYGYDSSGNTGIQPMKKSTRGNNLWEYTFDKKYTTVVFLPTNSWPSNSAGKTQDATVNWTYDSPCFSLDGGFVSGIGSKTGVWSDLGEITNPSNPTITELNPSCIYLDVSGMNANSEADWTSKGADLYLYISTLSASNNNRLVKATGIVNYKNVEYVYWDVSAISADTSGKVAFLYEGIWDNADTKDYYRSMNIDETTLETAKGNAYFWNGYDRFEVNGVWTYRLDEVDFNATYESDYSNGDKSIDIPKTPGDEERISNAYYASSTFYDYYSDYEMKTGNNKKNCTTTGVSKDDYKNQFQYFNRMIAQYYKNQSSEWNPLYFGDFWEQKNQGKWSDADFDKNWSLYKFNYYKNNSQNDASSAYQGLVDSELSLTDKVTMGGLEVPYFNASFLRNKTTPLAAIYENVDFPFTLNNEGYWEFDSAQSKYAVQLTESENDGYYLKRTNSAVYGLTGEQKETMGFFPFNDSGQSGNVNKLDYGFGMEMEIPFTLTSDGTVEMNGETKDIEFNFSGDDDIWIFIDGKLVLDIGGDHGRVSGSINFNTQESKVSGVKDANGNKQGEKITSFAELLPKGKYTEEHKMQIFYMERGVWESNMKITFNFPERNSIQVEKRVDIPAVDPIFDEAMENLRNKNFDFAIKNLVTDSIPYSGEVDKIEKDKVFNDYTSSDKNSTITTVYDVTSSITTKDSNNVISWYAKGEKKATDGQDVTDKRIVKVSAANSSGKQEYLDVSNVSDYLTFETYQDSNESGSAPFIALVDSDGTRIGGWIDGVSYQNNTNVMGSKIWRTMKVDLNSLKNKILNTGTVSGFDFSKVKEIQFAYWNDVTVYITPFIFNKATTVSGSGNGFTTDPGLINDYGSIESKELSRANGALYSIEGGSLTQGEYREVSNGTFGLTDGQVATFRDQFRKGSYIAIKEVGVDSNVFSTIWTLYEDGKTITSSELNQATSKVNQTQGKTSVTKISGTDLADGREILNAVDGVNQPRNAIAFYRYDDPDSIKSSINLKAVYTNTLKTGSLTIKKLIKEGEIVDQNKEYKFKVSFSNVAGMGLEGESTIQDKEFTLKPGEEITISGIPAGTSYVVKEIKEDNDEFTLSEIKQSEVDENVVIDLTNYTASGTITNEDKRFEFVNSVLPTIEIQGEKTWIDNDNTSRPESITIRLERKIKGSDDSTYEIAKDKGGKDIPDKIVTADDSWSYSYSGIPKYVDYTQDPKVEYEYRVIEIKVGDQEVSDSGYRPSYSTDENGNLNITNTRVGSITIKKIDENNDALKGAKFKLEKKNADGQTWTEVTVLDMTDLSEGKFEDLEMGDYRITEIKAPDGYNILKEPIEVTLPYAYNAGDIVNGAVVDSSGTTLDITFTITNVKGSILPTMGGIGTQGYVFIGFTLMTIAYMMYIAYRRSSKKLLK